MDNRHEKLGIKQTIQKKWMDKTVQMMLAGLTEKEIRAELDEYLSTQKQSGGIGDRGKKTYGMAISLLAAWFSPDKELIHFRNDALKLAGEYPASDWLPLHWAVLSASYPFWFNVAKQAGRLLNLQEQITQAQIFNRLKEQYGDRETVSRNARYTIRSFVAWDVLIDSSKKGCYEKLSDYMKVTEDIAICLVESSLLATAEEKIPINYLLKNPAFFPFHMPAITGDFLSRNSSRIEIDRFGLDEELLKLKIDRFNE